MILKNDDSSPYPRLCAHRGFNTIAPENSLPAFGAAVALGAAEIEMDVRETADGELVVCHDDSIDRISSGTGRIAELTFAQLRALDFGSRCGKHFAGLKIASLEEVLKAFAGKVIVNLHIKSVNGKPFPHKTMQRIVELIYKYGFAKRLYFMANGDVMETALEVAPEIQRCMAAGSAPYEIVENALRWQCSKVQLFKPHYNEAMIHKAHENGIRCNVFFSDDPAEARTMLAMGIDTILTNDYLSIANATGCR